MAEDFINISDCDEEEMKQLFLDNEPKIDRKNTSVCSDSSQPSKSGSVSIQPDSKKKTQKKSNSRQASSSTGKHSEGSAKSSGSRKGRQSKTPSGSQQGRHSRGEGDTSPNRDSLPVFTNDIHMTDNNTFFKLSLLDEVLTEKKMALMRSPEVLQFLQDQQAAKLADNKNKLDNPGS